MEMRGKGREFSTELPLWAKILHILLISVFVIVMLGCFLLAGYGVYIQDGYLIAAGVIFSLVFGWLSKLAFSNFTTYERWMFSVKLTEEGYFVQVIDQLTKEEMSKLIRFNQMEEVVISKVQDYMPRTTTNEVFYKARYWVGAMVCIIWKDEQQRRNVKSFTHFKMADLEEWLKLFDQHNVPLTVTHVDVRNIPPDEQLFALDEVEKTKYKWNDRFGEWISVGSITTEKPLRLEDKYKKVHSFCIPVKVIFMLALIFNVWFVFRIIHTQSLEFSVVDVPTHVNALLAGVFMYFSRRLSVVKVLKYLAIVITFFIVTLTLLSFINVIDFAFDADLFALGFMIIFETFILYPFIRIIRDRLKAEYHEEINIYNLRLITSPYHGNKIMEQ